MPKRALFLLLALALFAAACAPASRGDGPDRRPSYGETTTSLANAINRERASGAVCNGRAYPAVAPLKLESRLVRAAEKHSQFMRDTNTMSHRGRNGSTVGQRVSAEGYVWSTVGENIAWGQKSVGQVVAAWMDSKTGHCEAIMSGEFKELGTARVDDFWTLVFGTPR